MTMLGKAPYTRFAEVNDLYGCDMKNIKKLVTHLSAVVVLFLSVHPLSIRVMTHVRADETPRQGRGEGHRKKWGFDPARKGCREGQDQQVELKNQGLLVGRAVIVRGGEVGGHPGSAASRAALFIVTVSRAAEQTEKSADRRIPFLLQAMPSSMAKRKPIIVAVIDSSRPVGSPGSSAHRLVDMRSRLLQKRRIERQLRRRSVRVAGEGCIDTLRGYLSRRRIEE
jgi:hypothetical protein